MDGPDRLQRSRQTYEDANKSMRSCEEKEERLMLLESWRDFEREFGSDGTRERVRKLLPEKVKKRRKLTAEDGVRMAETGNAGKWAAWFWSVRRAAGTLSVPYHFSQFKE